MQYIKKINWEMCTKFVFSFYFFLIAISLIILKHSPAIGYESSIYKSTPLFVWISLILSVMYGITIVVYQIYTKKYEKNYLGSVGLLLIILCYIIVLSLFLIKGYYMWNMFGDASSHLTEITIILQNGFFTNDLFYPITHIYLAEFLQITNINLIFLHKFIPLIFEILQILFMYLFTKSVLCNKYQAILATIASTTFAFGWYLNLSPNHLSNLLFPLFCFIFIRNIDMKHISWKIILIIFLFLFPPFHIVPTISIGIIIVSLWVINIAKSNSKQATSDKFLNFKSTLFILLLVWSILWISSFEVWERVLSNIHNLYLEQNTMRLNRLESKVNYAQLMGYNITEYIFKVMGVSFLYFFISIVCIPIIWNKKNEAQKHYRLLSFYGPLFLLCVLMLYLHITDAGFGPLRLLYYIVMICTLFVGFFIYHLIEIAQNFDKNNITKFLIIFTIFFLVGSTLQGMLSLYPSPYILESSYQTTNSEVKGTSWFIDHENSEINISSGFYTPSLKLSKYLLTIKENKVQYKKYDQRFKKSIPIQLHFGYDLNTSVSNYYKKEAYLLISKKDKLRYVDVFPELANIRWTLLDFIKIENDVAVNKVYYNGEYNIYYVFPYSCKD